MSRQPRAAAQAASESIREGPPAPDGSDDEMADVPQSPQLPEASAGELKQEGGAPEEEPNTEPKPESQSETQQEESQAEAKMESQPDPESERQPEPESQEPESQPDQKGEQPVGTPGPDDNPPPPGESPTRSGGRQSAIPRKRRIGRPPKYPRPETDAPDDGTGQSQIRVTTPVKRRRGRPAASGGRWSRNRGPSHISQPPVDKDGNVMQVIDDEVVTPGDPEGDTKVNKDGHLQGDREYRVRTFTLLNRGDRLYMLSTEPARCIGFRDSYLFFQKHRLLFKIIIDDDAKRDLIERNILPHSYKGRAIGVVTARSVFREFGAKIVVGGRKIVDDYNTKEARERGDVEGEIAVPEDRLPPPGEPYNRNQFVAWHGASSVYHTVTPAAPTPIGKAVDSKKRKVTVTGDNWMLQHAREASTFNSALFNTRRPALGGVYDIHSNIMQYPKVMQPTHARWEHLPPSDPRAPSKLTKGLSSLTLTTDPKEPEEIPSNPPDSENPEQPTPDTSTERHPPPPTTTIFSTIPSALTRRFAVHDTLYETPPYSNQGIPGPDGDIHDLGPNGLITLASASGPHHGPPEFVSPEILAELPPECKEALVDAAASEYEWKSRWWREGDDGLRRRAFKSYSWFP